MGWILSIALVVLAAAPAGAATLLVTNTKGRSASVIDTDTLEVTGTIPLGPGKPNRIVFHPDGRTAWVVYDKSRDLGIIDADARKLVRRIRVGGNPYNLAFSPDGRYLYVLDWGSESSEDAVIAYDIKGERVAGRVEVSTWPAHAVFHPTGKTFYVSSETAGNVAAIDAAGLTVTATVPTGGDAMGLALTADGKLLYAAAGENRSIVKIDTATNSEVGTIPLPGIVHDAVLTLDGQYLFATLRRANRVVVVRTSDDTIVASIRQPGYPDLVVMEPTGRYALVSNRWANAVTVISLETFKQVRRIQVGRAPHGMTLRPGKHESPLLSQHATPRRSRF
jgi:YVTN family beta-propeller protein